MKILLISNMYPSKETPFFGTFVKNFKEQLEGENIISELAVISGKGTSKLDKIKKYFQFLKDVIIAIKKNNYDLIYIHYISHSLLPLLFVKSFIKKPLILNAHGSDVLVHNKVGFYIQKLVTSIIKKGNMIVVPSDYFKDVVSDKFQIKKENIFVSPSGGIDTKLFQPQEIKKEIFTIGYVSRIDKAKGWDTLLDAVSLLNTKGFTFKVLMLGGGAEEKLLLKKIEDLKLKNIVKFLGPKSHNELVRYFNQMSIFAFTTRLAESLGLVGLEAMACGVPVVGSNIGGLPSYIIDGVNGKLFEAGNAEELVESLEYFMNLDSENFQEYKANTFNTAQRYDSKIVARDLANKLKEICEQ
ncbi:glycosyltransferase family 4 protein [Poseidonibacter antarcticus]|uniref:glycosyltransferase family 4 protein n=1 Tax=Poseidonibacter antarcticus TaxID=2478538 RepID=UPI000EF51D81|nr:glycosyltransferase family 4 protein [Poseidonibacter antarcticus]